MCLPTCANPPVPQKRGMLMETSWLPDCVLMGLCTPAPPFSQLEHTVKTRGWGWRHSRVQGCCCVNWSCMLALLMENPHVRVDCSSPDAWGAGGRRPWAILGHSHVFNSADHLSTPFVKFINSTNTFKGPPLTAELNKALLKLCLLLHNVHAATVLERTCSIFAIWNRVKSWSGYSVNHVLLGTQGHKRVIQRAQSTEANSSIPIFFQLSFFLKLCKSFMLITLSMFSLALTSIPALQMAFVWLFLAT